MDLPLPVLKTGTPTCDGCVAYCCRYILIEIDRPEAKWQYDQIRWMLLHENISVGVDLDGDWFVEVKTRCQKLTDQNLCGDYFNRPHLCETYSAEECQVWNPEAPYKLEFKTADAFTAWLDKRGVEWRYKADEERPNPGNVKLRQKKKAARRG